MKRKSKKPEQDMHEKHLEAHRRFLRAVDLPALKVLRRREPSVQVMGKAFILVAGALEKLEPIERQRVLTAVRVFFEAAP